MRLGSRCRSTVGIAAMVATAALTGGEAGAAPAPCAQWTAETVASGYGVLENLAFDGRGNVLLSESSLTGASGAIKRLGAGGHRSVAVANVSSPGGIVVDGGTAYFNVGNAMASGLGSRTDGTIEALNLTTGARRTVARGLTMPNGLARLPGGDFVVSRDIGSAAVTTLTRVSATGRTTGVTSSLTSTNGLAYDTTRQRLVVSTTFNPATVIAAVDARGRVTRRVTVPGYGPLNSADDLTVGPDGVAYVTLNAAGRIVRVDLDSGRSCTIASGLITPSSVRFGAGPGWDSRSLYVTSFLGTLTRLTPR